jgi:glycine hydroxymethyltransferase
MAFPDPPTLPEDGGFLHFHAERAKSMFSRDMTIKGYDDELWNSMVNEARRQEDHIELIASENFASPRVLEAQGSVLTNKYAEGYPGKRYYGGCEYVDVAERLAIERVKQLFGAAYANVQPHSGSQANAAVYMALLSPGDHVLGMSLAHGGHLTHGAKVNFSGKIYNAQQYGVQDKDGLIDYAQVERLAQEHKPKMIVAGFSAYSRAIEWERFRKIADSVGAYLMVDMAHVAGLIAAGLYPNPTPIADVTTTTTHKTLRGPRGGVILAKANPEIEKKLQSLVFPGTQGGPLMHAIAAKAVAFKEALEPSFKEYQRQVLNNSRAMADVVMKRGYDVVSGGTDNHLILVSMIKKGITGKDAEAALGEAHITVNKNAVPNDPQPPMITSGLRLGTPAITTRGFGETEVRALTGWICDILDNMSDTSVRARVRAQVQELCRRFPVYENRPAEEFSPRRAQGT